MKKENKKSGRIFAVLLTIIAILAFAAILAGSFFAIRTLSSDYQKMKEADLSQEYTGTISYNDHIYVQAGCGISIDPLDSQKEERMSEFLSSGMDLLDQKVVGAGLIYAMMVSVVLAFPLYRRHRERRGRHILAVCLFALGIYVLFIGFVAVLHLVMHMPFYLPHGQGLLSVAAGILSLIGGSCALAMLLRGFRFKKIAAILVIPLVYVLFLFSSIFEGKLYMEPYEDSFAYVAEIDKRLMDEDFQGAFYDPDKNVLIVEGKEYPPEQVENADYLKGTKRYGAFAYEVLYPYSGTSLYMMEQAIENEASLVFCGAYALKGIIWIVLAFACSKRKA